MSCAKVTMNVACAPTATGVSFALAGSTVGATALSMLGGVVTKAGLMASVGSTPSTSASMTYEYLPIFGSDGGSLTCSQPPETTVVVTSPPAQVIH
jgi:hypothetical protein